MDTVSENLIVSIKMGPDLTCDKICHKLQGLINKYQTMNKNLNDSLLVIKIVDIVEDSSMIPKIEYKN